MAENTLGLEANKGLAFKALILSAVFVSLTACFGTRDESEQINTSTPLLCDDSIKSAMSSYSDTEVLLVKSFQQGEPLLLGGVQNQSVVEGGEGVSVPKAETNLCLVKLLIGPGNTGPEEAPSTSAGIGIEVLLPAHDQWNHRIRAYGNSGWSGTPQASLTQLASDDIHAAAVGKGFVVATSDNGHMSAASIPPLDPSFAMNPDGSINKVGWHDFSERSLQELAEKTKALTKLYYGQAHKYAYWDGFSTGGRQGLKLAQKFPNEFDGILVGAPAINWSKYHTAVLYAQIAMKQDLGYMIDHEKLTAATESAINACGGDELGFLLDPLSCQYDPTQDESKLCDGVSGTVGVVGKNNSEACLTLQEATTINKIWYGQTVDGSVPAPATDNGSANILQNQDRIWFGWTRGTDLKTTSAGGAPGIILAADQTALELQDPTMGSDFFKNATGNGENKWLDTLNYAGLSQAQEQGLLLQPEFSNINTDNPDLSAFAEAERKIVMYQGLADEYIPAQGAINYYERVMAEMGGDKAVQEFFRLYLIPGFTHSGRSAGLPNVPVPQPATGRDEMFAALQNWVESNKKPEIIEVESSNTNVSLPLCVYPQKITYSGQGSVKSASNYACN